MSILFFRDIWMSYIIGLGSAHFETRQNDNNIIILCANSKRYIFHRSNFIRAQTQMHEQKLAQYKIPNILLQDSNFMLFFFMLIQSYFTCGNYTSDKQ